ncbi:MAG TPA: hypothetical protein VKY85_02290 [Candidatus Angelobacter sp.]|nr:hypothetical protein [Candidatus Angelobacter sp.]
MAIIGKADEFEHRYTEKFRSFAAQFGHFVAYERDIAKRDIGLHLKEHLPSGEAKLTSCLCWFQLKGIMAETLPEARAEASSSFKYRMKVEDLRFWFLQPMPTYLALYIESLDQFFILNLQKYVEEKWGLKILTLPQKTTDVEVSRGSALDASALRIILRESTIDEWVKAMSADESHIRLCQRDYNVIWRIGTGVERKVEHRFEIFDWQSKTRGEVHIQERAMADAGEWTTVRNHWQLGLTAADVEDMYPYLDFTPVEEGEECEYSAIDEVDDEGYRNYLDDDHEYHPTFKLRNGLVAAGEDCSGEYHLYYIIPELNELGKSLFELIKTLIEIKFINVKEDPNEFISIAPWHHRQV